MTTTTGPAPRTRLYHWTFVVHLWTLTGIALAMGALAAVFRGDFDAAARLIILVLVVDLSDGTLARALRVRERMPLISGEVIDYLHDLVGLTLVPMVFLWRAGVFPEPVALPLVAAATCAATLKYGMKGSSLDLGYSLGAPPVFVTLLLCWFLDLPPAVSAAAAGALILLVLVPFRFPITSLVTTHWKPGWQSITSWLFAFSFVPILVWLRDAPHWLYWIMAANLVLQLTVFPLLLRLGLVPEGLRRKY